MALTQRPTLLDISKQLDPDGKVAQVVEVLNETNAVLQDAPAYEGNQPLGNRVTYRSSLPKIRMAKVNQGSVQSKGTTAQFVDTIGMMDAMSEVDVKAKIGLSDGDFAAYRWSQDAAFLEAFAQTLSEMYFYGDERTEEAAFTGLAPRLNALNPGTNLATSRVIDAGGTGSDNTSIYVVDWHERYAHAIYPKGSKAGVDVTPMGEQRVTDANSNPMRAFVTSYLLSQGLTVKDQRHIGRLCNIDVSDIATAGTAGYTGPDLVFKMIDLMAQMPPPNGAKRVLYCNQDVQAAFHKIAVSKANAHVTMREWLGEPVPAFQGHPFRRVDRISRAEARVV